MFVVCSQILDPVFVSSLLACVFFEGGGGLSLLILRNIKDMLFCSFPFSILCRARLVERYCLNLFLPWIILVSPSMLIESLTGYSRLDSHLCSLRVWMTSVQDFSGF